MTTIHCEWSEWGVRSLLPAAEVFIIVDVLSFSTCVEIAVSRGATVWPYRWKDESARQFARGKRALLAGKRGDRYSLSPASLRELPPDSQLVLPSPNGATLSLATASKPTLCGCLRNASAVARAALSLGEHIAVIPAGERWPDDSLRPCFEDWIGAGAIIEHLPARHSPEADAALAAWRSTRPRLLEQLRDCPSGRELIERGFPQDVEIAGEVNVSSCVPVLCDGAFRGLT
jgi:2-phosphosulfolactate phosphatase